MAFKDTLLAWYDEHGRALPWRGTDDPYRIWLSEVILQQTRIEQGRDYYRRFLEAFPTVADLAQASEEQVLKLWQGLGYYSRARNMHAAARHIVGELGGRFPDSRDGWMALRGVGRYTAAAVASFAFREPVPVVDGNVYRFVARLRGVTLPVPSDAAYRHIEKWLLGEMDRHRPDRFNAALMDFGSLQCTPRPDCALCPFAGACDALATGRVGTLPVRQTKRRPRDRWFYYVDLRWNEAGKAFGMMRRRPAGDIWQGLFELPLMETEQELPERSIADTVDGYVRRQFGVGGLKYKCTGPIVHQLTHRTVHAWFVCAELPTRPPLHSPDMGMMTVEEMKSVPVPRLIDKYLGEL